MVKCYNIIIYLLIIYQMRHCGYIYNTMILIYFITVDLTILRIAYGTVVMNSSTLENKMVCVMLEAYYGRGLL